MYHISCHADCRQGGTLTDWYAERWKTRLLRELFLVTVVLSAASSYSYIASNGIVVHVSLYKVKLRKLLFPRPALLLFNGIRIHFHLCVTGIPSDRPGDFWPLTFWPLNRFTCYPCDGLPSGQFWASYTPFRSRVRSRHATDRRTDRHRPSFHNTRSLWSLEVGCGHNYKSRTSVYRRNIVSNVNIWLWL